MTFFEAFNEIKKKYSDNDLIIYEIIFYLSKKVKNKLLYIQNRNEQIDFSFEDLSAKCNEYFLLNKPLGSIIKKTKFLGLEIDVFDNVLVPRNDTEFVCLKAKEEIIKKFKNEKVNIVDLCSGTGNIGIFLKKEIENSDVTCVDINQVSIENIKHNAKKNNVSIKVIQGDYFESLINNNLKFDVILMNPPYVSIDELDTTMTKYESEISFVNSKNPNDFYFKIISNLDKIIKNKGNFLMVFEISSTQKENLNSWLKDKQIKYSFYKDLTEKYRVLVVTNE